MAVGDASPRDPLMLHERDEAARRGVRWTTSLLVLYLWLVLLLPVSLVAPPLGGSGQPALLVGGVLAAAWLSAKLTGSPLLDRSPSPMRWALLLYAATLLTSVVLLQLRAHTELERASSLRNLTVYLVLVGVALAVADGVRTRAAITRVLRAVVLGAVVFALVGYVQFFLAVDLPSFLVIPGFGYDVPFNGIYSRGGVPRPAGTAQHPIEYGVVLGAVLPFAVHRAMYPEGGNRQLRWLAVAVIGGGVLLSLSRSGILAAVAAGGLLALVWSWRQRLYGAVAALAGTVVLWAFVPGVVGTLRGLVTRFETDPSAQARVERFPAVFEVVAQRPWLGRGHGTWTVEEGLLLDQQLYQTAIELGLVGLVMTLLLVATGLGLALDVIRRPGIDPRDRHLAAASMGAIAALTVTAATYTAFHYRIHLSLLFVAFGMVGTLWRHATGPASGPSERRPDPRAIRA